MTASTMRLEKEPAQRTLSAIGDVGVAIGDMPSRPHKTSASTGWIGAMVFFALAYLAARLQPLLAPACAALAFWSRERWRKRAIDSGARLKAREKAFTSLRHVAANAVNGIRANLIGFRLADAPAPDSPHLDEIERSTSKLHAALRKIADAHP